MTFKSDPENTQGINLWLQVIHLDSQPSSHINSNWITKLIKNQRNVILETWEGNKCLIKGEIRTHCWVHLDGVLHWIYFLFLFLSSDVLTENPTSMALLHSFHPGSKCVTDAETFVVQPRKSCCGVKLDINLCFHQHLGGTGFPEKGQCFVISTAIKLPREVHLCIGPQIKSSATHFTEGYSVTHKVADWICVIVEGRKANMED